MVTKFLNWYNFITGAAVTLLTGIFGVHWYIFVAYFVFEIFDWISGWAKARKKGEESSRVGLKGAVKKLYYWILIVTAFMFSAVMRQIAIDTMGFDLPFMMGIGWIIMAMLVVNEVRSICENLVELGVDVPEVFIKGLKITNSILESKADTSFEGHEDNSES